MFVTYRKSDQIVVGVTAEDPSEKDWFKAGGADYDKKWVSSPDPLPPLRRVRLAAQDRFEDAGAPEPLVDRADPIAELAAKVAALETKAAEHDSRLAEQEAKTEAIGK